MRRTLVAATLLSIGLATSALAQAYPAYPTYQPPEKKTAFQVHGGMALPAFSYSNVTDDIGWTAGATIIYAPRPMTNVRLDFEYNEIGLEGDLVGNVAIWGGGLGGGRRIPAGTAVFEGYLVAGLYDVGACVPDIGGGCSKVSELQFGTKFGFNYAFGRGKVKPMINGHMLFTWGSPSASVGALTAGLRF